MKKTRFKILIDVISVVFAGIFLSVIFLQSSETISAGDTNYRPTNTTNKNKFSGGKGENGDVGLNKTTIRTETRRTRENERVVRKKIRADLKEFNLESFKDVKKNFIKDDEVRIRYIAWVLYTQGYCKIKRTCLKIGLVGNAIIRAEGGNKTIYGKYLNNPFHIKYCMKKWYELGLVDRQAKFCKFKTYKSAIIAWWRIWEANKYNSNSIRTAIRYTGNDKPSHWLRIIKYYKNKFSYLIK